MTQLSELTVTACLLSLASNTSPKQYLTFAHECLSELGEVDLSEVMISVIDTSNHLPAYHNQMAYLKLKQPISYFELVKLTKSLEQQSGRQQRQKPLVTLDIDIIAIKITQHSIPNCLDEKRAAFIPLTNQLYNETWLGVARRFPLAEYDRVGISQLNNGHNLAFLTNA